jgi:hypothetical protein
MFFKRGLIGSYQPRFVVDINSWVQARVFRVHKSTRPKTVTTFMQRRH